MNEVKKLIRLHSTDTSGIFQCQFAEEILIEKNSEMSLHSTIFKIINGSLNVTTGDIGKFKIFIEEPTDPDGEEYELEFSIPSFDYTKMDIEDLLFQLNDITNEVLSDYITEDGQGVGEVGSYETLIRGRQGFWDIDKQGKIRFRIKAAFMIQLSLPNENVYKNMVFANGYFAKSDPVVSNDINQNYSYSKLKFIKGCGCARAQINTFTNVGDGGTAANFMGVGLTTRDDKLKDGTVTIEDLDFVLYTGNQVGDGYRTRTLVEGTSTETVHATTPNIVGAGSINNDIIQIELVGNKMFFIIHKLNNTIVSLNPNGEAITFDKTYYVVYFIAGTVARNRLNDVRYNIDPYQKLSNTFQGVIFANEDNLSTPNQSGTDPTSETGYSLDLITTELAGFLGFENTFYQTEISLVSEFKLIAESLFKHISHANSYVIELLNIQLDSYDSFTNNGGRRNILSVIPVTDVILNSVSGIVRYEPHTPSYISLKNKDRQIGIRNITLRILTQDMQPIQTDGLNFITVLIKNISNN